MAEDFQLSREHLIEAVSSNLQSNVPEAQLKAVRILLNMMDSQANLQVIKHLHRLKGEPRREAYKYLGQYYRDHYDELKALLNDPNGRIRENAVQILESIPLENIFINLLYLVDDSRQNIYTTAIDILKKKLQKLDITKLDNNFIFQNYITPILNSISTMNVDVYPQRIHLIDVLLVFVDKKPELQDTVLRSITNLYSKAQGKFFRLLNEKAMHFPFDMKKKILAFLIEDKSANLPKFINTIAASSDLSVLANFCEIIRILIENNINVTELLNSSEFIKNRLEYLKNDEALDPDERLIFSRLIILAYNHNLIRYDDEAERQIFIFYLLRKLKSPQYVIRFNILNFIFEKREILKEIQNTKLYSTDFLKILSNLIRDPYEGIRDLALRILTEFEPDMVLPILIRGLEIEDMKIRACIIDYIKTKIIERRKNLAAYARDKLYEIGYKILAKYDPNIVNDLYEKVKDMKQADINEAIKLVENIGDFKKLKPQIEKLMQHPNKHVRAFTVSLISVLRSREAFNLLVEALKDPDKRVVANVIEALETIITPKDLSFVIPFINDENNRVRANTAHLLYKLGYKDLAVKVIDNMLNSGDPNMINSALWVIRDLRIEAFEEKIKTLFSSSAPAVRKNAINTMRVLQQGMKE